MRRTAAALAVALVAVAAPTATTATTAAEPWSPGFYDTPAQLPATPGALLRSERMTYTLDPAGANEVLHSSTRIMYSSTDSHGNIVPTTGMVLVPKAAWLGKGTRPVVALAEGTQGLADKCAPSRATANTSNYEILNINNLLAAGYAVAVTDYQGLGTEGEHTYIARKAQGHALLDVARTVTSVPDFGLQGARVGLTGYSQGGTAAASAAELWHTYAPEVDVVGAAVGAPAADLASIAPGLEGTHFSALPWLALSGLFADAGMDLSKYLNEGGMQRVEEMRSSCLDGILKGGFSTSSQFTKSGKTLGELINTEPELKALAEENRIGKIAPRMPVVVTHSYGDSALPYKQARDMAQQWCDKGTTVRMYSALTPTHLGGYVPHGMSQSAFFTARFAGWTPINNCGTF